MQVLFDTLARHPADIVAFPLVSCGNTCSLEVLCLLFSLCLALTPVCLDWIFFLAHNTLQETLSQSCAAWSVFNHVEVESSDTPI